MFSLLFEFWPYGLWVIFYAVPVILLGILRDKNLI